MYGLKSSEVEKQREKYGSNKLPEKKLKTWFQFFMETFKDHINQILLAMMIVFTVIAVFGQGSYSEPIGVAVVLLAIALLGMNTGLKSQKSTKELKDRTSVHYCNVIRNGKIEHINTNDLVVGDLVIIQSGEAIHADGYLVEGNIKVDNSVLNGESEPCKKTAWDKEDSPIAFGGQRKADSSDYTNSYALFSGTTVTDGEGKMTVTNVGVETVNTIKTQLSDLKAEKDNAILTLETAQVTKSLQATPGMSSLEEDKMLEKVRDGVKKQKEAADGTKIAYENSASVQKQRLDQKMKDEEIEKKLAELKARKK